MKQFIKYRPIQLVTFLGVFMLSLSACELDKDMEPYQVSYHKVKWMY